MPSSSRGGTCVSSGLIARQMEELEEEQFDLGEALCHLSRHTLTTLPSEGVMSWGVMSWTGKTTSTSNRALTCLCLHCAAPSGQHPQWLCRVPLLLHTPITRRADHASRRRSARRSPRPRSSRGRNARRAGPNAAGVLVILSKHTIYIRFHLSLRQRNYEQVRLVHLIVVAVPLPQIQGADC